MEGTDAGGQIVCEHRAADGLTGDLQADVVLCCHVTGPQIRHQRTGADRDVAEGQDHIPRRREHAGAAVIAEHVGTDPDREHLLRRSLLQECRRRRGAENRKGEEHADRPDQTPGQETRHFPRVRVNSVSTLPVASKVSSAIAMMTLSARSQLPSASRMRTLPDTMIV